ncbi:MULTISPECIES: AzlC family ABC transporter permease [Kocuria]|uniref:Inner membrane protein YgaZ n=1 Tax=Kocuria varians TaxID=1272 RepID=A0A7D7PUA7_KOCVA|nr:MULTISPECIES: AzlC family ABC transporter permease [Kocuria]QMS57592.1 Inner membrane protein YgaZ [Kocuria varians]RUP81160.1 branched-chain amino acid ABC transporter permease [Kocuria sp. HSID17590]RUQ11658.1 branched-chain amino acid ABC transporter permease [Kocuria sp. HSID17582]
MSTQKGTLGWALRVTVPVAMGYLPLGMAFGAYSVSLGFAPYLAPLTALVVFAGSIEFLLVGLVAAGAGLAQIAVTTLLVNARHVFYGFSYPTHLLRSPFAKFYGPYALTDEAYALINSGVHPTTQHQLLLVQGVSHFYWVLGAAVGALAGGLVPESFDGFDFALTGLFALLFVGAITAATQRVKILTAALLSIGVGLLLPRSIFLLGAMLCYAVLCVLMVRRPRRGTTPRGAESGA